MHAWPSDHHDHRQDRNASIRRGPLAGAGGVGVWHAPGQHQRRHTSPPTGRQSPQAGRKPTAEAERYQPVMPLPSTAKLAPSRSESSPAAPFSSTAATPHRSGFVGAAARAPCAKPRHRQHQTTCQEIHSTARIDTSRTHRGSALSPARRAAPRSRKRRATRSPLRNHKWGVVQKGTTNTTTNTTVLCSWFLGAPVRGRVSCHSEWQRGLEYR